MEPQPTFTKRQQIIRYVLLAVIIALTVLLLLNRDKIQNLGALGYPGIFLVSLLSNATILVPLPGVVITAAMAVVFNPLWVAFASGLGAGLGELSGYLAGVGGQVILARSERYTRLTNCIDRGKGWPILLLAFLPNPLFDMAGFIAGSGRMPVWKFLLFCISGKIAKMLVFAYLGIGFFSIFKIS